jgi:nucleoside-diphosphate-sugar epimerase
MPRPTLIITGASGFVGRHLLEELKDDYRIFAIARRSQRDCGAPVHSNIAWMQVDIGDVDGLTRTFREITSAGGAKFLFHLAGYYDYALENRPEYRRTNIDGTRNVLELSKQLHLSRFLFASSVAACAFPRREGPITEATPPDGRHIYAWSKREGERMVREEFRSVQSCIVRFGAVYSDWCEYPPLYLFLSTWLGRSWKGRILAGKGESAIPYIHIRDVVTFFRHFLAGHDRIRPGEILVACTPGCTSHRRLFELATRSFLGTSKRPLLLPAPLCGAGMAMMSGLGRVTGHMPFERLWMYRYIDRKMEVDGSHTRARLDWSPSARYQIERRLPFVIERMKSEQVEWHARNAAVMRRDIARPDLAIFKALVTEENQVVDALLERVGAAATRGQLPAFAAMDPAELAWLIRLLYRLLLTSVQTSNRMLLVNYLEVTGASRFKAGFTADEICLFLKHLNETVVAALTRRDELKQLGQETYDRITVPIELGMEEVRGQYERFLEGGATALEEPLEPAAAEQPSARELLESTIWSCLVQRR